ncbi:MAG: hypothetical protein NTU44_16045 [Bacteroidetes bacterium]|nr:hypothetical protein [Bacteroidota bacterium]
MPVKGLVICINKLYCTCFALTALFFAIMLPLSGQNVGYLLIEGQVYVNDQPASSVDVKVFLKDKQIDKTRSINNGRFVEQLKFNQKYRVEIGKTGLVTKKFIFNSELPESANPSQIYIFPLNVDLFPPFEEVDMSLLEDPMAVIEYDKPTDMFAFDIQQATEHVKQVQALQKEIMDILEVKAKLYKQLFSNAELAFKERHYQLALDDYRKTLKVYPETSASLYIDVDYINNKIKSIELMLAEKDRKEKAKDLKKKYDQTITKADAAFDKKLYDEAYEQYSAANEILPEDNYPRKRIEKINDIIAKNIVITLNTNSTVIKNGKEIRLTFTPVKAFQRKGNYLIIRLKRHGEGNSKLFVKFGKGGESGGGFVLKNIPVDDFGNQFIRLNANEKWFRMDANWFTLYAEGGDIEVEEIKLSKTE